MDTSTPLHRAIRATLAYFDQFDFPLTAEEVWRWLIVRLPEGRVELPAVSREVVSGELHRGAAPIASPPSQGGVRGGRGWEERDSFFFLPGRREIVDIRRSRIPINEKKWAIARRGVRWLQHVPFIKLIGVCNTVAVSNARPESDIDVFIVVGNGKLWTARFFATALMDFLRLRRRGTAIRDRMCMSFYVTEGALDLRPLLLKDGDDPYFAFWAAQMVPMLDRDNTYARFVEANAWVREYLPNAFQHAPSRLREAALVSPQSGLSSPREARHSFIERFFRAVQKNKMARNAASAQNEPNTDVVISDQVLKFHERDRRREYREEWKKKLTVDS